MAYITQQGKQHLKHFQYKGGTQSITYKYIWGPLAQNLLKFIPLWIAPNLITLTSLLLLSVVHAIFMFYGSQSQGIVPSWKLIMMATSLIIYQNLDNIDGKQAKRTDSSSVLGMLFDHGIDSIASFYIAIQFVHLIGLDETPIYKIGILYVFVMLTYFSAMWSQYSSGQFKLAVINPVDQGIPIVSIFSIMSIFNQNIWKSYYWFRTWNQWLILALLPLLIIQLFKMNSHCIHNMIIPVKHALNLWWLPISVGISLLLLLFLDSDCIVFMQYILLFMWSRNMIEIQLCFAAKQKYNPFNIATNFYIISVVIFAVIGSFQGFNEYYVIYWSIILVIEVVLFIEFVVSVFYNGAKILEIDIFSIKVKLQ